METAVDSADDRPAEQKDRDDSWGKLLKHLEHPFDKYIESGKVLLAILAVGVYAIVRSAYESFYGRLGLTPDEVGHTYAHILERALLGMVGFAAIFVLLFTGGIYSLTWLDSRQGRTHRLGENAVLIALVGLCIVPNVVSLRAGDFLSSAVVVALLCALPLLTILWLLVTNRGSRLPIVSFAIVIAMAIVVVGLANRWGEYQAERVLEHQSVRPEPLLGIFALRADAVCVAWATNPHPDVPELGRQMAFLGEGHGFVHLVSSDKDQQRLLRIPASLVTLSTPAGNPCP